MAPVGALCQNDRADDLNNAKEQQELWEQYTVYQQPQKEQRTAADQRENSP